ncbi:hypothetical protein BDW59DRAFT_142164 [Aspergillus cavernicola]|uniref:Zn(2)-C6 fungal-type domain-containing protein n=1 Tax=Aspergillus cavernicola TaxID=176166 RepID=A0ABR4INY8_9EURO
MSGSVKSPPVRACTNCVRAKAKCCPGLGGEKCDRCSRMNKECHASPPVRKRRAAKNARVQKLEERLDGLVVLLQSTINPSPGEIESGSILSSVVPTVSPSPGIGPIPAVSSPPLEPSITEAESYLHRFRNEMVGNLPFLVLSPTVTAQQLRQEKPLLWFSIMVVASNQSTQQSALSKEMRAMFGRKAYVEGVWSLDFLWAVLVYITWDTWHNFGRCPSTGLVQLAISIVYDLALDKPPLQDPGMALMYDSKGYKKPWGFLRTPTLEEQRAVLGCFLVSAVRSIHGRGESLKWTPRFDQYMRTLEEKKEYPSDMLLIQLVKLRLITENATEYLNLTNGTEFPARSDAAMFLKSLQLQLRAVRTNIPSDLLSNKALLLELYHTESTIHQLGFLPSDLSFSGHPNHRFACIYGCMQAVKSWIDAFFTIPPAEYIGFSLLMHSAKMQCCLNICRLAICDHPEWDRGLLHENINVSWVLDETSKRMAEAGKATGMVAMSAYELQADTIRNMKRFWDTTIIQAGQDPMQGFMDELGNFSSEFLQLWDWS